MSLSLVQAQDAIEELLDPEASLRRLASGFRFSEGPVWHHAGRFLRFSDIQDDTRWRWSEERGAEIEQRPCFIGNGMVYDAAGDLLVCEHVSSSVVRIARDGGRHL